MLQIALLLRLKIVSGGMMQIVSKQCGCGFGLLDRASASSLLQTRLRNSSSDLKSVLSRFSRLVMAVSAVGVSTFASSSALALGVAEFPGSDLFSHPTAA